MNNPINIDSKKEPIFVKIQSNEHDNEINISYAYHVLRTEKKEGSGNISCYIPAFDIFFFGKSVEDCDLIGDALMQSFFNFWFKDRGVDKLAIELNRLGFKAQQHPTTMMELTKRRKLKGTHRFSSFKTNVPKGFESAKSESKSGKLQSV